MGKSNKGRISKIRKRMAFMAFGPREIEKTWTAAYDAALRQGKTKTEAAKIADKTLGKTKTGGSQNGNS